jgi:NAD(P)H-dependent flavin oxidoreductase YrpB (nitropropane dioxygenase family)
MLTTRVCDVLGIEHPVILGGMGSATNVDLVVAVSEAGGLGVLGATGLSPDQIRDSAAQIRARTSRPFGLNLLIAFTTGEQLDACLQARVPVLSTAWGDPAAYAARAQEAGVTWMHMVQTAAQAAEAARLGAAVVVAQGHEGGGHVGEVSTLPLVPAAVDAIAAALPGVPQEQRPPVVAAGGIADGRGLAAALALGAAGVLLGTRFLATHEAPIPDAAKRAICAASEADTVFTPVVDLVQRPGWLEIGAQCRALRTPGVMEWVGREAELRQLPEEERHAIGARWSQARQEGDTDAMAILAGEDSGLIHEVLPAGEVVRRVVAEAEDVLRALRRYGGA